MHPARHDRTSHPAGPTSQDAGRLVLVGMLLVALRMVTASVLHHASLDRVPTDPVAAAAAIALAAMLLGALPWCAATGRVAPRARRAWWGGRCWRAPPVAGDRLTGLRHARPDPVLGLSTRAAGNPSCTRVAHPPWATVVRRPHVSRG